MRQLSLVVRTTRHNLTIYFQRYSWPGGVDMWTPLRDHALLLDRKSAAAVAEEVGGVSVPQPIGGNKCEPVRT